MLYITLDTCVWLELVKIELHKADSIFEEFCFWIENKHISHIVPENMIREWDRNKSKKLLEIINNAKTLNKVALAPFKGTPDLFSAYQPKAIEEAILKRIERVDTILKSNSEIARENAEIYDAAVKRNFECLAPNHCKDSFRDTINILTIISHIKGKGYNNCIFSTINYNDFSSDKTKKDELHPHLAEDFKNSNLQYVYCQDDHFANKLLNVSLRPVLPSFQEYLKNKEKEDEERKLAIKKTERNTTVTNPDTDYLDNVKYIDMVLAKKAPTAFELELVKQLIGRHESYKQYFFKNIGNNGLV